MNRGLLLNRLSPGSGRPFMRLLSGLMGRFQLFKASILILSSLFMASPAMACILLGAGNYWQNVNMTIATPSNGQTLGAQANGQAFVNISGNAKLVTSIDGLDTPMCIYNTFKPTIGFVVDGAFYAKGNLEPTTGTISISVPLSVGTHTISMRASTNFNPTGDFNNHTANFQSAPVSITVTAGPQHLGAVTNMVTDASGNVWLMGYACDYGVTQPVYAWINDAPAIGPGTAIAVVEAQFTTINGYDLGNEQTCNTPGVGHGWILGLNQYQAQKAGHRLYAFGVEYNGTGYQLANSGAFIMPAPAAPNPKPTLSLVRTPSPMVAGQNETVTWTTTNATALSFTCTANGGGFSGSANVPQVNGSNTAVASAAWVGNPSNCTWTATGPGGSTSAVETLTTVTPPTIQVARTPMMAGKAYTLTWSTSNATSVVYSCTATGTGFSGAGGVATVNGSSIALASAAWVGHPSTCVWTARGPGGSATFSETLTTTP